MELLTVEAAPVKAMGEPVGLGATPLLKLLETQSTAIGLRRLTLRMSPQAQCLMMQGYQPLGEQQGRSGREQER